MHPDAWLDHFNEHVYAGLDGKIVNVSVGDTDLKLEIASTDESRKQGLAGTWMWEDGMFFMYVHNHNAPFTNAGMGREVSIWFFDGEGNLVASGWNEDGIANAEQVLYRYVIETHPDTTLSGRLVVGELEVL